MVMMKRYQVPILIISILITLFVVAYGIKKESEYWGEFNGFFVHLFVLPFAPLALGLISNLFTLKLSKKAMLLINHIVLMTSFLLLTGLIVHHYHFDWQKEWILFLLIINTILLGIEAILYLMDCKKMNIDAM